MVATRVLGEGGFAAERLATAGNETLVRTSAGMDSPVTGERT